MSTSVRIYVEGLQTPTTNAERSQDLSLTPRKQKFKSDLAEKKQQLSRSKKLLLEKSIKI